MFYEAGGTIAMTHEKAAIIIGNIPINWEDGCYSVCEYQEAKRLAVEALGKWKDTRWIPVTERLPKKLWIHCTVI